MTIKNMTPSILNSDLQVLSQIIEWMNNNQKVALVTVVSTWGSSPRPVGSLLGISASGEIVGSVSGGCIEEDLIAKAKNRDLWKENSYSIVYQNTTDNIQKFDLPCGGKIELFIETQLNSHSLETLCNKIKNRETITRKLSLQTGKDIFEDEQYQQAFVTDEGYLIKTYGPQWRLILIGAGELAQYVSNIALMLDYDIYVCDPREEYIQSWPLENITLSKSMPDDLVTQLKPDLHTAIITLTHDPKIDDMALMAALESKAFYIGALGSSRTNNARRERLSLLDLSSENIKRLHGPVGLDIGSRTPAEIALSIMAGITASRNNKE